MKYTVFSIDDSRQHYTTKLRNYLDSKSGWEYVHTNCVNGRNRAELEKAMAEHGYELNWQAGAPPTVGQLGIWYTVLNSLDHAPVVTFEDDTLLGMMFDINFKVRARQIPEDFDFFSLFLPRDSDHLWSPELSVSAAVTRTYQRYGGVSMYYSKKGAENIRRLLRRDGITGQYDDTLYMYSKSGQLAGYCSKPALSDLVYITGEEVSIVQESEQYV